MKEDYISTNGEVLQKGTLQHPDGHVLIVSYGKGENDLHRLDGPAWIRYDKFGGIRVEQWWVDNEKMKPEQVVEILKQIEFDKAMIEILGED